MTSVGTPLLVLIGHLLPHLGADAAPLQRVVSTLEGVAPEIMQSEPDLIPVAQDLILGLQHNPGATQGQMVVLNDLAARFTAFLEGPAPQPAAVAPPHSGPDPTTDPQHSL